MASVRKNSPVTSEQLGESKWAPLGTNVHSYLEKGNKYISTFKSRCFKEVYDFMLGHTHCSAGPHASRGPRVGQPCPDITFSVIQNQEPWVLYKGYRFKQDVHSRLLKRNELDIEIPIHRSSNYYFFLGCCDHPANVIKGPKKKCQI